jgi:tRNA A58 N-methylase Trm61
MEHLQNGYTLDTPGGTFPLSTDSMLLADFIRLPRDASVLDLGAGCGTLGLLLCAKDTGCAVTGIELTEDAHTAALDQAVAIKDIGSRLKMTHVHDNYKNGDHHQIPALGSLEWGCIDWKKPMGALKEIGYEGSLALELVFPPVPMYESFVKLAFDSLNYLQSL